MLFLPFFFGFSTRGWRNANPKSGVGGRGPAEGHKRFVTSLILMAEVVVDVPETREPFMFVMVGFIIWVLKTKGVDPERGKE